MMFLASTTSEVENDHANVIMQGICNKFIHINFRVGYTVSQPNQLFQRLTTLSLITRLPVAVTTLQTQGNCATLVSSN